MEAADGVAFDPLLDVECGSAIADLQRNLGIGLDLGRKTQRQTDGEERSDKILHAFEGSASREGSNGETKAALEFEHWTGCGLRKLLFLLIGAALWLGGHLQPLPFMPNDRLAPWDKRSLACKVTWITLRLLRQHRRVFKTAGKLTMGQLAFWHSSKVARDAARKMLLEQVDGLFREMYGAQNEPGVTRAKALGSMDAVLLDKAATLADLAAVADEAYEFLGEVSG